MTWHATRWPKWLYRPRYDQKANAMLLLTGEQVCVRNRNREGQGKLHGGWDHEPYVIPATVGDSELMHKVQPEQGGKYDTLHWNSLELCTSQPSQPKPSTLQPTNERHVPIFYCLPTPNMPAEVEAEPVRCSSRPNLGVPPARYTMWELLQRLRTVAETAHFFWFSFRLCMHFKLFDCLVFLFGFY